MIKATFAVTSAFLLAACATPILQTNLDCSEKPAVITSNPIDFGSEDAKSLYQETAIANRKSDTALAAKLATEALQTFDMPSKGQAAFIHARIGHLISDNQLKTAKADFETLKSLNGFKPGQERTLSERLKRVSISPYSLLDQQAKPLVRLPPIMPDLFMDKNKSGHCILVFDVNSDGNIRNITATYCTDPTLEKPSIESLSKWKYQPAQQSGKSSSQSGLQTKITFLLTNECGHILPE